MKQRIISALLAGLLCAGLTAPAGAAETAADTAAVQDAAGPAALTPVRMGLRAVRAAVADAHPTALALHKTADSLGSTDSLSGALDGGMDSTAQIYESLITRIEDAMTGLEPDSPLYITYQAQLVLLEGQKAALEQSIQSAAAQVEAAIQQMEDAAYQLDRQADNVAGQMALGAQSMLIGMQTLNLNEEQLERQLASLDRSIAVLEVQFALGMVSRLELDTVRSQRDTLARAIDTLDVQYESLGSSIALLCGYGADTMVVPSTIPEVYDADLRQMDYDDDLEQALDNSFSIWQSRNELRQAQNARDEDIPATVTAVQAAQEALEAEQDTVRAAFDTLYQNVQDSVQARDAAQTAAAQAELDVRTSTVQYDNGMISRLAYQQAQDTLADARLAVESAQLSLRPAYTQYEWALEGVMTSAAETA